MLFSRPVNNTDQIINSGGGYSLSAQDLSGFRPSYARLSYFLKKSGFKVNMELPGIDMPESVERIYKESEDWLNE